ncbi:MAG: WG repeat-containing protein [Bacteroidia bacterium]
MKSLIKILIPGILFFFTLSVSGQNSKGKVRAGYDVIHPYKGNPKIAKVEKDGKQGFIREDGSEIVPCKYDNIYPWEKGRAKVEIKGKYGYIKREDGEEYIPVKYDFIGPFINGLAIVALNGRRGLINEEGQEVVTLDNK